MKCPNCKHTLPDGSDLCQYCGTLIEIEAAPAETPTEPADEAFSILPSEFLFTKPVLEEPEPPEITVVSPIIKEPEQPETTAVSPIIKEPETTEETPAVAPVVEEPEQPETTEETPGIAPSAEEMAVIAQIAAVAKAVDVSAVQAPDYESMSVEEALTVLVQNKAKADSQAPVDTGADADPAPVPEAVTEDPLPEPSPSLQEPEEEDFTLYDPPEAPPQRQQQKWKTATIILSFLLIGTIAGLVTLFFRYDSSTVASQGQLFIANSRIDSLTEQVNKLNKTIDGLNEKIKKQDTAIATQEATISSQTDTISQQNQEIAQLKPKSGYFDDIVNGMQSGNAGYATSNFFASNSVLVVKMNDNSKKFTLTANWSSGGTVEVKYSSECAYVTFDENEWYTSTEITAHPVSKGVTVATFSNDVDYKTFNVLIIVTD